MTPPEVAFRPLSDDELPGWLGIQRGEYLSDRMHAGDSEAEARANVEESMARLFSGARPLPGHLIGAIVFGSADVGHLWVGPRGDDPTRWWVWDITMAEDRRGQGLGRATMLLAERLAHDAGATSLGLNVFGFNTVARGLYRSLGYEETAIQMRKDV